MATSRISEVKAPQHFKTRRSCGVDGLEALLEVRLDLRGPTLATRSPFIHEARRRSHGHVDAIAATALSLTRRDGPDVVRTASNSEKKPFSRGDDS